MTTKIKTPSEVRDEMTKLRSTIRLSELMIRTWTDRADRTKYLAAVDKQVSVIREARAKIKRMTAEHKDAPMQIIELQQRIRHCHKQLTVLENYALIRQLESITKELDSTLKETTA